MGAGGGLGGPVIPTGPAGDNKPSKNVIIMRISKLSITVYFTFKGRKFYV